MVPPAPCPRLRLMAGLVLPHHGLAIIRALLRPGLAVLLNEFALHALVLVGLWGGKQCAGSENPNSSENQTGRE